MRLVSLSLFLSVAACGSSAGGDVDAGVDSDPGPDASPEPRFGEARVSFSINEVRQFDGLEYVEGASVIGAAYENEPPSYHAEAMRDGACRMLRYQAPTCTPVCDGICLDGNVCDPFPTFASVGTATVSGLKTSVSVIEFDGRYSAEIPAASDIFDPGDVVGLSVSGAGGNDGFSLSAQGVATLDVEIGAALTIVDGRDNVLEWSAGRPGDRVRLILKSTNEAHGLPLNFIIECDAPDTGSLTIPQAMVEAFPPASGGTVCASVDCPASELWRYRSASVDYAGSTAELVVRSAIAFPVMH